MKNSLFLCLLGLLVPSVSFSKQWTISNVAAAQFSTIGAAMSSPSVLAGDTLLISPSTTVYTFPTITKRLVYIGGGVEYTSSSYSFGSKSTRLDQVFLGTDSATTSGSEFYGLSLETVNCGGGNISQPTLRNVKIVNCYIYNLTINNGSYERTNRITFISSVINGGQTFGGDHTQSSCVFISCIFASRLQSFRSVQFHNFYNCLFTYSGHGHISNSKYLNFENCIFYGKTIESTVTDCNFNYCLYYYPAAPLIMPPPGNAGSNNITALDPLFINFNINNVFSNSFNYRLQATSPGKNAGSDGTDLGIYGGTAGFSIGFEPNNSPKIRDLQIVNGAVPVNGTININSTVTKPRNN